MRYIFSLLAVVLFCCSSLAQKEKIETIGTKGGSDTGRWKNSLEVGLNFSQAGFSSNWKGGGVNSYALGGILNANTLYEKKGYSFAGRLNTQYGLQNVKGQGQRKTIDVLLADVKAAHVLSGDWNIYTGANLLTQFDAGYEYSKDSLGIESRKKISDFFAPAYLTIPLGFEYKPNDSLFVRLGVAAVRYTFVMDEEVTRNVPKNYGVDTNKTYLRQFGMQVVAGYIKDFNERIGFKANYFGFLDYGKISFQNIVHRLDVIATAKVTRYISTSFSAILFYDYLQDPGVQISQALNVGFLLKLDGNDKTPN